MTRDRLTEDVARAIFAYVVGVRRYKSQRWDELDDKAKEIYRGMARVAIGTVHAHRIVFGKPTIRQRIRQAWDEFVKRNIIADDPWENVERKPPTLERRGP